MLAARFAPLVVAERSGHAQLRRAPTAGGGHVSAQGLADQVLTATPDVTDITIELIGPDGSQLTATARRPASSALGEVDNWLMCSAPIMLDERPFGRIVMRKTADREITERDYAIVQLASLAAAAIAAAIHHGVDESGFPASFDYAPVGLAHVALDGSFLCVNDEFCRIAGHDRQELAIGGFQRITHPDDLDIDLGHLRDLLAGRSTRYSMEKRYIRSDGEIVWIDLSVSIVPTRTGEPDFLIAVIEDISEAKRDRAAASIDPLTGILNRRGLTIKAERALARAAAGSQQVCALYLDLDGFKAINDQFGHAAGDEVLVRTAQQLTNATRPQDIVARVGGDEMVVILIDCPPYRARSLASRIGRKLRGDGGVTSIRASIGVAAQGFGDDGLASLIAKADEAMRRVKPLSRR